MDKFSPLSFKSSSYRCLLASSSSLRFISRDKAALGCLWLGLYQLDLLCDLFCFVGSAFWVCVSFPQKFVFLLTRLRFGDWFARPDRAYVTLTVTHAYDVSRQTCVSSTECKSHAQKKQLSFRSSWKSSASLASFYTHKKTYYNYYLQVGDLEEIFWRSSNSNHNGRFKTVGALRGHLYL